jgi:anti-sigma B factor antagonist
VLSVHVPPARFEHVRDASRVTLHVHGELDLCSRSQLRAALDDAAGTRPSVVVVDLADVTFIDSSGMHELVRARRATARRGGRFVLASPSPLTLRLLEVWQDTDTFEVEPARS